MHGVSKKKQPKAFMSNFDKNNFLPQYKLILSSLVSPYTTLGYKNHFDLEGAANSC